MLGSDMPCSFCDKVGTMTQSVGDCTKYIRYCEEHFPCNFGGGCLATHLIRYESGLERRTCTKHMPNLLIREELIELAHPATKERQVYQSPKK